MRISAPVVESCARELMGPDMSVMSAGLVITVGIRELWR